MELEYHIGDTWEFMKLRSLEVSRIAMRNFTIEILQTKSLFCLYLCFFDPVQSGMSGNCLQNGICNLNRSVKVIRLV